ncbi:MAG: hypothetical protein Q4P08_04280, partial [Eubacteriales bacterium]|nr:hypothetical protein [Eubacteriales bacterium]
MFNFMKAYRRLLRETVKYHDKSFLPACLSLMFLRGLLPVMMALMPKLIASVLISVAPTEEKIKRVLLISGLYALIGLVAGFSGVYIQQRTRFRRAKTRMIYARDVQQHMYEVDFSFFESGELYRRYDGGISVVNAPSEGINGALDATVRLTANFFS